jgi:hypothetical protein
MKNDQQRTGSGMMGKRSAGILCAVLLGLAGGPAVAQSAAPSGGVDVQTRVDDLVETYAASKTSLAFLLRDVSFGYEITGSTRGALGSRKFSQPRRDIDQTVTPGQEPRGIIIAKGPGEQPLLYVRFAGAKSDIRVQAKFIRSNWQMLIEGRTVTMIAPAGDLQILPKILGPIGIATTKEVAALVDNMPPGGIETLGLGPSRSDADQVIIQGNNMGFTVSYPSVTASYRAELKAEP